MFDFGGKTAIVTGAARGIGRQVALDFARQGANVCLCDINREGLHATAAECGAFGAGAVWQVTDVADESDVSGLIRLAVDEFGTVGIAVNNAGILADRMIEDITADEFDRMLAVHVRGAFLICRGIIPYMRKEKYGRIVNITSLGARQGVSLAGAHYCAAKGAVTCFTRQLAQQLKGGGVTVNCVAPGTTRTELISKRDPEVLEKIEKLFPVSRLCLPEEVSAAVLYLASDWARCITGETLDINGGKYMT